jgi:hypothetical protein
MNLEFRAVVLGCILTVGVGVDGRAQAGYPNVDRPVVLGAGDTVRLLNRILVDRAPGQRGTRMDIQYSTRIPAGDSAARAEQADRLVRIVGIDAWKIGARRVTLSICDTRACAETREPPRTWYAYERGIGGTWQRSREK